MKKGMKKILSVAIVLAMTMSLAACGGGTKETQGQASSETAAASGESAGTEAGETSVGEIKRGWHINIKKNRNNTNQSDTGHCTCRRYDDLLTVL